MNVPLQEKNDNFYDTVLQIKTFISWFEDTISKRRITDCRIPNVELLDVELPKVELLNVESYQTAN
jgi:hypothetical protein